MGYFEANPTFLEPEGDLVFGLYDIDMDAAAPHLEASMRVFPALARFVKLTPENLSSTIVKLEFS